MTLLTNKFQTVSSETKEAVDTVLNLIFKRAKEKGECPSSEEMMVPFEQAGLRTASDEDLMYMASESFKRGIEEKAEIGILMGLATLAFMSNVGLPDVLDEDTMTTLTGDQADDHEASPSANFGWLDD